MNQPSEQISRSVDHQALEHAGRTFIAVWCRSQDRVAGHVPPTQLRTLEVIAARPHLGMRDLAAHLGMIPSSASRLCDRLVAAGLLVREPSDVDRRQVVLRATPEGEELLRDLARQRRRDLEAVLDRMPPEDGARLLAGLLSFAEHAERAEDDGSG
ncbi:hypothetical protein GCM10009678_17660 [Actinomadura kijaniata]|uniref:DNA-binding MarR family transcriptional regulator n=1 Tax=Actinomadura namibiensis TaxID=182080 RepID=A0A7W3LIF6_ACTNM|nr:MarR family winged helix-turn-helix transcriptional regulator [Actinomadura namibiensis]MBA8948753.1 DNA-binding MarR family transcriptional regulator [Actinomadura namibiensis]